MRPNHLIATAAIAALLAAGSVPVHAQTGLKAGVAKVAITPEEPIWMAGYEARKKPSEGIRQPLYAKALALQDESGKTAVLLTLDLSNVNRALADTIAEQCRGKFGLSRDRLVLNVSHTHSGPVTTPYLDSRPNYQVGARQQEVVRRYTAVLVEKIVGVAGSAIRNLAPATVTFGQGLAGFAVNRRRVALRQLPAPVDHDVPVLAVRAADGTLRAVVAGYSCHGTVLSDFEINGDWPGYAQEEIEKSHPGTVALFVQGAGADANPLPRRSVDLAHTYGKILAAAVEEVLTGKMKPVAGPLQAAYELVPLPFHQPPSKEALEQQLKAADPRERLRAEYMLKLLERDPTSFKQYPYPVQVWRFGSGLNFIALGGELVVDYALRLKAQHGWQDTWVAGYSNDVFGYVPSRRVLAEGGYEGGGAMIHTNLPGPFSAAVEETIVEKVGDMLERLAPPPVPSR